MKVMKALIETIGALVFAGLLMAIPILTPIAYIYSWADGVTFILTMLSTMEFVATIHVISNYL